MVYEQNVKGDDQKNTKTENKNSHDYKFQKVSGKAFNQ